MTLIDAAARFMVVIGLIGGIASGKSAAAAALARRGAVVFDADRIGHAVLDEADVREALVARWGGAILGGDGRISRPAIAGRVFGDAPEAAAEREFLEKTLHGRIRQRVEAEIDALSGTGVPAVVIDAPLLIEAGWADACDVVALVDAPREQRLARARQRGWTPGEFARREAAQMPIEQKRGWSTHALANTGSLAELDAEVARFWAAAVA